MINVHHILLAAGESKRMGEPKQLLNWGNKNLIQYQIENILPTTKKLYVVIGAYSEIIEPLFILIITFPPKHFFFGFWSWYFLVHFLFSFVIILCQSLIVLFLLAL